MAKKPSSPPSKARGQNVPRGTIGKTKRQSPPPPAIELIVRGLLWHGSRLLLCRNLKHGYLYLPGGHIDPGESAAAALAREFLEEGNLPITVGPLGLITEAAFTTPKRTHQELNLVFHVEHRLTAKRLAAVRSMEKQIALEWTELAALPELDLRPLAVKAWLLTPGATDPGQAPEWVSEIAAKPER